MQILAGHAQDDKAPSRRNHMTKHEIMHVSRCGGNALWLGRDKTCLYNCVGGARDIFCNVTFKLNNVKVGANYAKFPCGPLPLCALHLLNHHDIFPLSSIV